MVQEVRMPRVDQFVSVTEAKNRLLELIRNLKQREEVVAITRDGTPAAVLLSMAQFEGLMETIDILSDAKAMPAIRKSLREAELGRWVSHERLFGKKEI
jgi:prevent-host-death family protein